MVSVEIGEVYSFVFVCRSLLLNQLESHPATSKLTLEALVCSSAVASIIDAAPEKRKPVDVLLLC